MEVEQYKDWTIKKLPNNGGARIYNSNGWNVSIPKSTQGDEFANGLKKVIDEMEELLPLFENG